MVHFDRLVVRDDVAEFARVLASGGGGFVHHSNYGIVSESQDWQKNPAWRSNMTRGLFLDYCERAGRRSRRRITWIGKIIDTWIVFRIFASHEGSMSPKSDAGRARRPGLQESPTYRRICDR